MVITLVMVCDTSLFFMFLIVSNGLYEIGIRNTISNIINRPCSNIATNTIDELCNYLNIYPKDFFIYSPYFIRYIENEHCLIIKYQNHKYKCDIDIKYV